MNQGRTQYRPEPMPAGEIPRIAAAFGRTHGLRTQAGILAASASWRRINGIPIDTSTPNESLPPELPELLTTAEAAAYLNVSVSRVNELARTGKLDCLVEENNGVERRLFTRETILERAATPRAQSAATRGIHRPVSKREYRAILEDLHAGVLTQGEIAKKYDRSQSLISNIRHGKRPKPPRSQVLNAGKLTIEQVREIRAAAAAGEKTVTLARKFGVNKNTISNIKHGRTWAGIE